MLGDSVLCALVLWTLVLAQSVSLASGVRAFGVQTLGVRMLEAGMLGVRVLWVALHACNYGREDRLFARLRPALRSNINWRNCLIIFL